MIVVAVIIVLLPLVAVVAAGLRGPLIDVLADATLWRAAARSLTIALSAGVLALVLGWAILLTSRELRMRRWRPRAAEAVELSGSLVLVVSPIVLGAGLFVALMPLTDVFSVGLELVVVVNAMMGLPYVIRLLGPPLMRVAEQHDRLCASLGIAGLEPPRSRRVARAAPSGRARARRLLGARDG